jgi:2-keto-4-pentenoate hydratase/2-oxohepta-3-ene-1,7-dioic acid hydratase in catechol pathway
MLYKNSASTVQLFGQTVPEPKILLDFLGFETHVKQIRDKRGAQVSPFWYDHAAYYIVDLPADKMYGTGETVTIPTCTKAPDYEFEIGCLVTEHAILTNMEDALAFFKDHCYLTILNDWSARDIQKKDMEGLGPSNSKFVIGKSIGPKLVKAGDLKPDANGVFNAAMTLTVNGEVRSQTNYETLYHTNPTTNEKAAWSFPRIFTFLGNENIALHPGYLIGSGTVGNGCIAEFMAKVDPKTGEEISPAKYPWLKDGDTVKMEVAGLGVLENKVAIKELASVK